MPLYPVSDGITTGSNSYVHSFVWVRFLSENELFDGLINLCPSGLHNIGPSELEKRKLSNIFVAVNMQLYRISAGCTTQSNNYAHSIAWALFLNEKKKFFKKG